MRFHSVRINGIDAIWRSCPRCRQLPSVKTEDVAPPYYVVFCCGVNVRGKQLPEVESAWNTWADQVPE